MRTKLIFLAFYFIAVNLFCADGQIQEYVDEMPCDEKLECCTPQCLAAAKTFNESLNTSVSPCDDFYLFACGGYINKSIIDEDQKYVSRFIDMERNLNNTFFKILESPWKEQDIAPLKIMKHFYRSCMDEENIKERSTNDLHDILKSLGGWPVLSQHWNSTGYSLFQQLVNVSVMGPQNYGLFNVDISRYAIYIHRLLPIIGFGPFCQGLLNTKVQKYYKFMIEIVTLLGGDVNLAEKDMWDVVQLEYNLTRIYCYEKEPELHDFMSFINETQMKNGGIRISRNDLEERFLYIRFKDLDYKIPGFPWKEFINITFADYYKVKDDDWVAVGMPFGIIWAAYLMNTVPERTLSNLVLWRMIYDLIPALNREFRELRFNFSAAIANHDDMFVTRNYQCMNLLKTSFSRELLSPLLNDVFTKDYISQAKNLMSNLKTQLVEKVVNMSWVSNSSRPEAIKKAESIKQNVAMPDQITYSDPIIRALEKLELQNNVTFTRLLLKVLRYDIIRRNTNRRAGIRHEKRDIFGGAGELMEFYIRNRVKLGVPVGYLQEIFFDVNNTDFINYGGIGMKITHCMGHAFDSLGIEYNHRGYFDQWADGETRKNHAEIVNCLEKLYENTTAKQKEINDYEEAKYNEIFSDNFAVRVAYDAFLSLLNETKVEKRLPGMNYTTKQMFWLQEAVSNCEIRGHGYLSRGEFHKYRVPKHYRVNIPLGNSPDFRRDWNCSSLTKMGSQEICNVW